MAATIVAVASSAGNIADSHAGGSPVICQGSGGDGGRAARGLRVCRPHAHGVGSGERSCFSRITCDDAGRSCLFVGPDEVLAGNAAGRFYLLRLETKAKS